MPQIQSSEQQRLSASARSKIELQFAELAKDGTISPCTIQERVQARELSKTIFDKPQQDPERRQSCPFSKLSDSMAKIVAYKVLSGMMGRFWTAVEAELEAVARDPNKLPICCGRSNTNKFIYLNSDELVAFTHKASPSNISSPEQIATILLQKSVGTWLTGLYPKTKGFNRAQDLYIEGVKLVLRGLEMITPETTILEIPRMLQDGLRFNQELLAKVIPQIQLDLGCSRQQAHQHGLQLLRSIAKQHITIALTFAEAVRGSPLSSPIIEFDNTSSQIQLSTPMLQRMKTDLRELSRRKVAVGCPAIEAKCTLPSGATASVMDRYMLWVSDVHERCVKLVQNTQKTAR